MKKTGFATGIIALVIATAVGTAPFSLLAQTNQSDSSSSGSLSGPHAFGSPIDLSVTDAGIVKVDGVEIQQFVGTTFYGLLSLGNAVLHMTIRTSPATIITKKYGETMALTDMAPGDYVTIQGTIYPSSNSFDMTATNIKDWNVQTESSRFSGTVIGSATTTNGVVVKTKDSRIMSIHFTDQAVITKGNFTLTPAGVHTGDVVLQATGIYDHPSNIFTADSMKIYQDMSIFQPKNFQGTIKTISTNSDPKYFTVTVKNQDYTVIAASTTAVLNKNRAAAPINRFIVGDTVRIYGAIREFNQTVIDAQILRNLDL